MGFFRKLQLHIDDKFMAPTAQAMKLGADLTEKAPAPVKAAAVMVGSFAGSMYGGFRACNPVDIIDSVLTPEKEMEERVEKKMKAVDF